MDEVANTYVGRFILQNGKDLYGNPWPLLYFDKFGDFPPVIPMYLSGFSTMLFGVTTFAARFPAAFIGALLVFPLYILFNAFFSKKLAIVSCLCLAIFPWHVALSRSSSEGIIGLTVFITGITFLLVGIQRQNTRLIFFSWFWFMLSYILYPSFRILTPLVLLPLPFIALNKSLKKILWITVAVFFMLTLVVAQTDWGRGRFNQTSLFLNTEDASVINNDLQQQIATEGTNAAFIARVFHNKPIGYGQRLLDQYLDYFSPQFLFLEGGLPKRYAIVHVGLLYITFLLLAIFYLMFPVVKIKRRLFLLFLYFLLVAALPAAISVDDFPNVHRAIFMIFPLTLFMGIVVLNFFTATKKVSKPAKIAILTLFGLFVSFELIYSHHQYFTLTGKIDSFYRTEGNVQMAHWLLENKNSHKKIIVANANWLPIYFLFAKKDFDSSYIGKFKMNFNISNIENIHFTQDYCPPTRELIKYPDIKETVIVIDGNCSLEKDYQKYHVIERIQRVDGTHAYSILRFPSNVNSNDSSLP